MKATLSGVFSVIFFSLPVLFIFPGEVFTQNVLTSENKSAIPDKLTAIFQNSCKPCHWQGGKFKSTFHVNFSKWDNYSHGKQAEKAKKICTVLLNEEMPPASVRKFRPEIIPTKDQVDAICKWSETMGAEPEKQTN